MNSINTDSTIKRKQELVSTDVDGEKVMMSTESGEYFGLDPVGSRIWELIEDPVQVKSLIESLVDEFDVSQELCISDTLEFLNELLSKKLIILISD